jgi:hypothetical protein
MPGVPKNLACRGSVVSPMRTSGEADAVAAAVAGDTGVGSEGTARRQGARLARRISSARRAG